MRTKPDNIYTSGVLVGSPSYHVSPRYPGVFPNDTFELDPNDFSWRWPWPSPTRPVWLDPAAVKSKSRPKCRTRRSVHRALGRILPPSSCEMDRV